MGNDLVKIPPEWMAEVKAAYEQYCIEWEEEEAVRVKGTGEQPEPVEPWNQFLREYLYAELQNCVYVETNERVRDR